MPERGLALTFGALLVIAIAAVFGLTSTKPSDLRNLLLGRGSSAAAEPAQPAAPAAVNPPKHSAPRSRRQQTASPAAAPAVQVINVPVQVLPAPRESDIRPSMSRSELVSRFGAPDLMAAWSEAGKLNERLYYHRTEGAELEVVVQNGKVVNSRTATN